MSQETPQEQVAARRAAILAQLAALDDDAGPASPGWTRESSGWQRGPVTVRRLPQGSFYAHVDRVPGCIIGPFATSADAALLGLRDQIAASLAAVEAVQ